MNGTTTKDAIGSARRRKLLLVFLVFSVVFLGLVAFLLRFSSRSPEYTSVDAMTTDDAADFAVQGEYLGEFRPEDQGERRDPGEDGDFRESAEWEKDQACKVAAQIRAIGKGRFFGVVYEGGLPGDGWMPGDKTWSMELEGVKGEKIVSGTTVDGKHELDVYNGRGFCLGSQGNIECVLHKIERKSPTLGAKPPEGAVVLFDGTTTEAFKNGTMPEKGLLGVGVTSKQEFGDQSIHLEFRVPFSPKAQDQKSGNSGCYVQGRYEVQILDSFALEGKDDECGAIYKVAAPRVNMTFPPLAWQTYDIDFTAPRFDAEGKKTANARMTVLHNGVPIHDDIEVQPTQTNHSTPEAPTGPLLLQNHKNPVRFRNIWVIPKHSEREVETTKETKKFEV